MLWWTTPLFAWNILCCRILSHIGLPRNRKIHSFTVIFMQKMVITMRNHGSYPHFDASLHPSWNATRFLGGPCYRSDYGASHRIAVETDLWVKLFDQSGHTAAQDENDCNVLLFFFPDNALEKSIVFVIQALQWSAWQSVKSMRQRSFHHPTNR